MRTRRTPQIIFILVLIAALAMPLAGCSGGGGGGGTADPGSGGTESGSFKAPEFKSSAFHGDKASSSGSAVIDTSAVANGYVAVSAKSSDTLKFQVKKGDDTYTYDLAGDGTPAIFPLTLGNGTYAFYVMENISGNKYACMYSKEASVSLKDEFQPYLRPSEYINYKKDSACVKKANELAKTANSEEDVVAAVYDFVTRNVDYDRKKAEELTTIVPPDPDETMETGKGICFDYAALTAAMLRSQGIPTKVIFGYVSPDDVYHAWNMFYTEETGWVTVEFSAEPNKWNRLDLTFSAGGTSEEFVGDGSNYSDVFQY